MGYIRQYHEMSHGGSTNRHRHKKYLTDIYRKRQRDNKEGDNKQINKIAELDG